jgi:opacity protein-like surface antigen
VRGLMRSLLVLGFGLLPLVVRAAGPGPSAEVREPEPRKIWEAMVETTQTIGADNSRDNYFATQFVSLAVEPFRPWELGPVRVLTQLINSLVVSAILEGPDTYYIGWAPQVRAIVPLGDSRWSLYGAFAAGLGYADANENNPNDGGLGQDFNFLFMASAGLRYALSESWSVWAGGVWMHLSNGEMSEPRKENIGVDSFGAMLGVGWSF